MDLKYYIKIKKRLTMFLRILILGVFFFSCASTTFVKQETHKKKVFLFAGQSNMEGRADAAGLSEKDLQRLEKVKDRIAFYYNHFPVSPLQLTTPKPYIQRKFSLEKSFGPELFFGIELAENYPDQEFIFIKRSQGGTSLYGCWNPYWSEEKAAVMKEVDKPKLFLDFVDYGKSVLGNYNPSEYEICGMLWVQGEADSGTKKGKGKKPSETYGENLRNLIKETRKEFKVPDLPFMLFQVGSGKVVKGMQETAALDKQVFLIPQSKDKNSPDYYEKNPPPIGHYVAKSMKRIGERFFEVFQATQKKK